MSKEIIALSITAVLVIGIMGYIVYEIPQINAKPHQNTPELTQQASQSLYELAEPLFIAFDQHLVSRVQAPQPRARPSSTAAESEED